MSRLTKLFQTRTALSLLTAAIVALFIKLSIWQWHRYQFKKNLEQTFISQVQATPKELKQVLSFLDKARSETSYSKIIATGHYAQKQFLLDNRTKNNQVGFDVITPFILTNGKTILVDRGFVPADSHRHVHTDITPPTLPITLIGLLSKPSKSFIIGPLIESTPQTNWPKLIMRIDPNILSQALHEPLLPYIVLLDHTQPYGFVRNWSPPNLWAARSLGYCFQWLAMALTVLIIYFILYFKTKEQKNVSTKI